MSARTPDAIAVKGHAGTRQAIPGVYQYQRWWRGVGATGRDWAPGYSHGGSPASRGDGIPSPQQAWIVPVRCVLAATIRATTTSKTGRCGQRNGAGKVNQASGRWVEV
nr:MAG TPA: hypothetical protein [Caudoviricetes sp.]